MQWPQSGSFPSRGGLLATPAEALLLLHELSKCWLLLSRCTGCMHDCSLTCAGLVLPSVMRIIEGSLRRVNVPSAFVVWLRPHWLCVHVHAHAVGPHGMRFFMRCTVHGSVHVEFCAFAKEGCASHQYCKPCVLAKMASSSRHPMKQILLQLVAANLT